MYSREFILIGRFFFLLQEFVFWSLNSTQLNWFVLACCCRCSFFCFFFFSFSSVSSERNFFHIIRFFIFICSRFVSFGSIFFCALLLAFSLCFLLDRSRFVYVMPKHWTILSLIFFPFWFLFCVFNRSRRCMKMLFFFYFCHMSNMKQSNIFQSMKYNL